MAIVSPEVQPRHHSHIWYQTPCSWRVRIATRGRMDSSDVDRELSIMIITIYTNRRLNGGTETTPEKTQNDTNEPKLWTHDELTGIKSAYTYSDSIWPIVGESGLSFTLEKSRLSVKQSHMNESVLKNLLQTVCPNILYLVYYFTRGGNAGER